MNSTLKLMMIDDNKSCNLYHRIMMEEAQLSLDNLVEFNIAQDALAYFDELLSNKQNHQLPDVILLDINMPKISGWDFIVSLKEIFSDQALPRIYLVSNSRHPIDILKAKENPLVYALKEKHLELSFFQELKSDFQIQ